MDDLVSRKDAIAAIMGEPAEMNYGYYYAEKIKALSAAQPKIIHCKDCKWWDKQDFLQGRCALLGIRPTGGWFCANADMRGENE